ncbi:hypothetical protein F2Q68_00017932 [Brassica cretica]|uniref:3-oxoacyl-[acyl-carrier-protein] reductase n=1 Tax=Brassica cretica TaxID=69181 RepID=A0A8S9HN72_BRACR|nr:hypothetical protein F2Q68_00017932 [Brassica cretica]
MIKWRCFPELVQVYGFRSVEVLLDTPPGSPKNCPEARGDQFSPLQSCRQLGFGQVLSDQPAASRLEHCRSPGCDVDTTGPMPYRLDYEYWDNCVECVLCRQQVRNPPMLGMFWGGLVFPRPRTQRVQGNPLFAGSGRLRRTGSCPMAEYYTTVKHRAFDLTIVTGSSRGIGRAIAINLAELGARVVVNYTTKSSDAELVPAEINGLPAITGNGPRAIVVQANVSEPSQVNRFSTRRRRPSSRRFIFWLTRLEYSIPSTLRSQTHQSKILIVLLVSIQKGRFFAAKKLPNRIKQGGGGRIILLTSSMTREV